MPAYPPWKRMVARTQSVGRIGETEEAAFSLAVLRIVIPPMMLIAPGFRESVHVARWDPARWVAPEGLGWFAAHVPIRPWLATAAEVVAAGAAFHAMLGLRARLSLGLLLLSSFYLYSIAQLTGFVWHDMHLLWLCALLAVSPCDRVLAIDGQGSEVRAPYTQALWFARLLLAAIYFFPGLHKVLTSGVAWALSDNLLNQLYWKWLQHGAPPPLRLDRYPWLLEAGGLFTLAFELGFPLLMFTRKTRALAAAMGLVFHALSAAVLRISFPSLWICYVVLASPRKVALATGRWAKRLRRTIWHGSERSPASSMPDDRSEVPLRMSVLTASVTVPQEGPPWTGWPLAVVGCLLITGAVVQGVRGQMAAYPFACYPTFQWMAPREMPDLTIELVSFDGAPSELVHARDEHGYRTQRQWGEVFRLAGVTGPVDRSRLWAYFASVARTRGTTERLAHTKSVRFFRVYWSVLPDHRQNPPTRRDLLWEGALAQRDDHAPAESPAAPPATTP